MLHPWRSDWTSIAKAGCSGDRPPAQVVTRLRRLLRSAQANAWLNRRYGEQAKGADRLGPKGQG